jgi:hypothetical protein
MPAASPIDATLDVALTLDGTTVSPTIKHTSAVALAATLTQLGPLGGPTDLWGYLSITPAQINGSSFGVCASMHSAQSASLEIDQVGAVTVYYTVPGSSGILSQTIVIFPPYCVRPI